MRLAILGAGIHTVRWVNEMATRGHDVHFITMHGTADPLVDAVNLHVMPFGPPHGYFLNALVLRRTLGGIKPDLLHVHYASGYGTLGSLTGFHPRIVSVWGSDVYDFPSKSPPNHWLVSRTLRTADWVCSTSQTMAKHTERSFPGIKRLSVIPFGIDVGRFYPDPSRRHPDILTVGTVKTLHPKYGIRYLIEGFGRAREMLRNRSPSLAQKLRLLIVGGGPERAQLESLVGKLGLGGVTRFTGAVPHSQVPEYLDQLDIYVAVSIRESESFGVAVLEASACGLPVVVSAVGGLPEVVVDGVTGFVVEKKDALATAEALLRLIEDPRLRQSMGESGRQHVFSRYQWAESARLMEDVYRRVGTPSLDHIECPSCYVVSASAATILPRSWRNSMFHLLGQVMPSDHSRQVSSEYYLEWALGKLRNVTQVMDLGCGAGDFLDYFRKKDASIRWVGLDIEKSPEVDSRTRTGGEFCTYDGVHIPFGDNSFDLIYCKQVFEHVRYPLPLLKQIHRVLKPNGYFVGSTSQLGPYHSFSFWNYTPYGFLSLLEEASLQLIEIRPGIDGPTLILRRSLGTSRFFDRWFSRESPFNRVIGISGRLMGKSHAWINAVKLLFCGHFCFLVKKKVDTTTLPRPSTAETDAFDLP